jgi:hypothetical protein
LAQQNLGFHAGSRAELDEHAAVRHAVDNLGGVRFENRSLRARWIILRQACDLFE